jgi:hypothetical protein
MNKESKLSVENKLNHLQINTQTSLDIRRGVLGMQQIIQHKNSPNLSIKTLRVIAVALW